jgi:hypothetical protein
MDCAVTGLIAKLVKPEATIILQTEQPSHQRIPIPAHKSLRVGTLSAILRLVANHKGVSREAIASKLF